MTFSKSMTSSKRVSWNTPERVLDLVRKVFEDGIGLDPASNSESIVDAAFGYREESGGNGLIADWGEYETVYLNPPYGRAIGEWIDKCGRSRLRYPHLEIIALLPARPDTRWFAGVWKASALCFWRGRLRFLGAPSSAPFPSVVAYWGPRPYRFADVFSEVGRVVFP